MKLIYIAGPFDGEDKVHDVHKNILEASKIALECWRKGWAVICPHKNTEGFQHYHDMPHELWMEGDLEILSRCDAVLFIPGWQSSSGALEECRFAMSQQMLIFFYNDNGVPLPEDVSRGLLWPRKL